MSAIQCTVLGIRFPLCEMLKVVETVSFFGFFDELYRYMEKLNADVFAFAFDRGPYKRAELLSTYKLKLKKDKTETTEDDHVKLKREILGQVHRLPTLIKTDRVSEHFGRTGL